jgi:hypothetical protein
MGHSRLGRLPKTLKWRGVVGLLEQGADATPSVAGATVDAAEGRLRELAQDQSLGYCFWLLARIASAARQDDFRDRVQEIGLTIGPADSTLAFIGHVADQAQTEISRHPESGPFGELASLALRRALTDTAGQVGRSLFGSTLDDLRGALSRYSTATAFGNIAHNFFGDFLSRTLRYFVDRELANRVGSSSQLSSIGAAGEFNDALDLYARQSARIMERFASGWFGKHDWQSRGGITREEAQAFVAVALRKLRQELAAGVA